MDEKITERLQQLRKQHGYSQEELADKLGVSRQAVSKWERGEAAPDTDNLIALAKLYNMSLDDLLYEKPDAESEPESEPTPRSELFTRGRDEEDEEEDVEKHDRPGIFEGAVSGISILASLITFLLLGTLFKAWHPAWIVFFAIPIATSLAEAIYKKDAHIFAYPILVTAVYLVIGFVHKVWHPYWVVFLTVPVYYIIVDLITKIVRKK